MANRTINWILYFVFCALGLALILMYCGVLVEDEYIYRNVLAIAAYIAIQLIIYYFSKQAGTQKKNALRWIVAAIVLLFLSMIELKYFIDKSHGIIAAFSTLIALIPLWKSNFIVETAVKAIFGISPKQQKAIK